MIFITLGSQKFQFNRLLRYIDELINEKVITETVFAQIGSSDYKPINYRYIAYLKRDKFQEKMKQADIVVTHAGTGAIITALKDKKRVIAIPRMAKFKEHVDDHQQEIAKMFVESGYIDVANSKETLKKRLLNTRKRKYKQFSSGIKNYVEFVVQNFGGVKNDKTS